MAIYRPQRRGWRLPVVVGVAALVAGLLAGYAVWGRREPDAAEAVRRVRAGLRVAAGTLEVAGIEYGESVEDGRVVRSPEYRGAVDALARSRTRYAEVAPAFRLIDPDGARRAEELYAQLEDLVEDRAAEDEVRAVIEELGALLGGEAEG